jgi:hypothetical protein
LRSTHLLQSVELRPNPNAICAFGNYQSEVKFNVCFNGASYVRRK